MAGNSAAIASLSTGLDATDGRVASIGSGSAAGLGGGAGYDAATGAWSAPSYTMNNVDGSTSQVSNVGDALAHLNSQGTKYFHANSTMDDARATGSNAVAVGPQALASGDSSVAMGQGAQATGTNAVAIGTGALATGSQAIGASARAGGGGVALGDNADAGGTPQSALANGQQGTAIGFGALVQASGGVALGAGSVANRAAGVAGYVPGSASAAQRAAIESTTSTQAAVSVGDDTQGRTRQITGVAAGSEDSDATNVAQLKAVNGSVSQVQNQISGLQTQLQDVRRVAYSGVALSLAMSATSLTALQPGKKTMSVGVGNYESYSALALNYRQMSKDGAMSWGLGVGTTGSKWGVNAAVGWSWE
jgi:autotransporter adhesin